MKNLKRISIVMLAMVTLLLSSCNDDSEQFVVSSPTAPVLAELSITDIELDPVYTNNPAITLNWSDASYGVQTAINYSIQFSSDSGFTSPVTVSTVTGAFTVTLSVNELNSAAGSVGLPPFQWNALYARVVSSLGTQNSLQSESNVIQMNVFPFFNYIYKEYYLVGDATAPGWNNNNNNPPLFRDPANDNKYYYTGYFGAGQFKALEVKGLWQPQWGTNDGSTIDVNPGGGSDPGTFPNNNSPIATAGFYSFEIDFSENTRTYTFSAYDASGAANFTGMSVQGSATPNGGTPTAINQLAHDGHIWYINNIHLVPGDLQFITNTASVWGGTTEFAGQATENGGNIPVVVEDDYDVWFNDLTGRYILIPLNL
jgi:hypothetical protein